MNRKTSRFDLIFVLLISSISVGPNAPLIMRYALVASPVSDAFEV